MRGNFHEAHEVGEIVPPAERSTGLVFAGAAVVFAVVFRAMPVVVAAALAARGVGPGPQLCPVLGPAPGAIVRGLHVIASRVSSVAVIVLRSI